MLEKEREKGERKTEWESERLIVKMRYKDLKRIRAENGEREERTEIERK